jgi:long-chain acyl-CoA synthetase
MSLPALALPAIDDPRTLFEMFCRSCSVHSDRCAYVYRAGEQEIEVTYQKLFEDVLLLARAFSHKGVGRGDRIMLLADNRYGWIVTDLAIMSLGGIGVPRGSDTPAQELQFIMENSSCTHLVVETEVLFEQHRSNLKKIGGLKNIFIMTGPALHSIFSKTYSYNDLLKDRTYSDKDVELFIKQGLESVPDDLLTVMYTSGTTGMPKGVMLTHSNVMHNVRCIPSIIELTAEDRWLSVLPTWHIFERTAEYVALAGGCCLVYSSVKTFAQDLVTYRPTVVATVPRIWESLNNRVLAALRKKGATASSLFNFLVRVSAKFRRSRRVLRDQLPEFHRVSALHRMMKKSWAAFMCLLLGPFYLLAQRKFLQVQARFGGRLRLAVSGGGSLADFLEDWIDAIGIRIVNAYGMTECSPAIAGRGLDCETYGTLGTPVIHTDLRIVSEDGTELCAGEEGLIEVRGPQVTIGYDNDEVESRRSFTADGFLKTGDLGKLTVNGELVITGRAKDIIVLASGENVDPTRIESTITMFPFIEDAVLVGQDRKGLAALLVPNHEELKGWAEKTFSNLRKETEELLSDNRILEQIRKEINLHLRPKRGFKAHERLMGITFLEKGLKSGEELTNTLKKKRHIIERNYRQKINQLFH